MGYCIELGYPALITGESFAEGDFEIAAVRPFEGGSELALDPVAKALHDELYEPVPEECKEEDEDSSVTLLPLQIIADGNMEASVVVTSNYSARIEELIGTGLRELDQQRATEGAALLLELLAGLDPEETIDGHWEDHYWEPSDRNISHVTNILLGWTFQHPDATFKVTG